MYRDKEFTYEGKTIQYETHNDLEDCRFEDGVGESQRSFVNGTSLQGYIIEDYETLRAIFGEPHNGDAYKVDAEWDIKFEDGEVATIYNYKTGFNYNGCAESGGIPTNLITDWHIGGNKADAVDKVSAILSQYHEEFNRINLSLEEGR